MHPSSTTAPIAGSFDAPAARSVTEESGDKLSLTPPSDPINPELLTALSPVVSLHDLGIFPVVRDAIKFIVNERAGSTDSKEREGTKMPGSQEGSSSPLMPPEGYAKLFYSFRPPSSSTLTPGDLIFSQSYVEWASLEAQVNLVVCRFLLCLTIV